MRHQDADQTQTRNTCILHLAHYSQVVELTDEEEEDSDEDAPGHHQHHQAPGLAPANPAPGAKALDAAPAKWVAVCMVVPPAWWLHRVASRSSPPAGGWRVCA